MSETLIGHLHVLRTAKRPRGGLMSQLLQVSRENAGIIEMAEWPRIYFMHIDGRTVGMERAKVGDDRNWRLDGLFMFRFKGRPKLLDKTMEGYEITVRGSYDRWENGLGGFLKHYRVVAVEPSTVLCPCKSEPEDSDE